jgi:hypothetical protein
MARGITNREQQQEMEFQRQYNKRTILITKTVTGQFFFYNEKNIKN